MLNYQRLHFFQRSVSDLSARFTSVFYVTWVGFAAHASETMLSMAGASSISRIPKYESERSHHCQVEVESSCNLCNQAISIQLFLRSWNCSKICDGELVKILLVSFHHKFSMARVRSSFWCKCSAAIRGISGIIYQSPKNPKKLLAVCSIQAWPCWMSQLLLPGMPVIEVSLRHQL